MTEERLRALINAHNVVEECKNRVEFTTTFLTCLDKSVASDSTFVEIQIAYPKCSIHIPKEYLGEISSLVEKIRKDYGAKLQKAKSEFESM